MLLAANQAICGMETGVDFTNWEVLVDSVWDRT